MTRTYVLDANAVLVFFDAGPGGLRVREILREAVRHNSVVLISVVNLGEVFYILWLRRGAEEAKQMISDFARLPVQVISVDLSQALKAGEIKALHKIPYVDCMAAALAAERQATLVTSDRDFEKLGRRFPILWLDRP
jgi:predicted nucleic acid-binding protein